MSIENSWIMDERRVTSLAIMSLVSWNATAVVSVYFIIACSSIFTWVGSTFIDIWNYQIIQSEENLMNMLSLWININIDKRYIEQDKKDIFVTCFTTISCVSWNAIANVRVNTIDTCTTVLTWARSAFIDIFK